MSANGRAASPTAEAQAAFLHRRALGRCVGELVLDDYELDQLRRAGVTRREVQRAVDLLVSRGQAELVPGADGIRLVPLREEVAA